MISSNELIKKKKDGKKKEGKANFTLHFLIENLNKTEILPFLCGRIPIF